ncbi:MAG: nuclear transport factor 2 family protein [Phenylobacterium sp.]|jgi:hypothetical protein|uniref:DUF6841 family protein n=1 Tax=Phenylobacterium sp. TaxID=1871053 RepID=UPI002A35D686|nr:nuclear transport factor 2 family protein [Phenylobacterium sp.]MDX9996846.1 nuclear transport factor 2 family protein [Phenylobacterium sp.]
MGVRKEAPLETRIRALFDRYARAFNQALVDEPDLDEIATFYAPEFIAASPAGVATGRNDDRLRAVMAQGYDRYRAIGTRDMRVRSVRVTPVDDLHALAHVAWIATYARPDLSETRIDFEVAYLVQDLGEGPRIFGWVTGDEEAALKAHGVV